MFYAGSGAGTWIWMILSMIVFWGGVVALLTWAARSYSHRQSAIQPASAALGVLQGRFARGEISAEEFSEGKRLIG
ncbi:MAG: SHOCT domain-containing protein [Candidatus Dormibacteria bacterium]